MKTQLPFHYRMMHLSSSGYFFGENRYEDRKELAKGIITGIAFYTETPKSEITGKKRDPYLVSIRRVLSYYFARELGLNLYFCAELIGFDNHATVIYHRNFIENRIDDLSQYPEEEKILNYLKTKVFINVKSNNKKWK